MNIWLRYRNGDSTTSRRVNALALYERHDADRASLRTLSGVDISHRVSWRFVYELSIGADELVVAAAYDFVRAWFIADRQWLSSSTAPTEPADELFYEVTVPTGTIPIEFLEGNRHFPSFSVTIAEKRPRSA